MGQFKLRNPKITTIFGTNTCEDREDPEGLVMESIAAPESYEVADWNPSYKVSFFLNPVDRVSKEHCCTTF